MIKRTNLNSQLLPLYMKHNKLYGKQQIIELIKKLKENIENSE